MAPGRLRHPRFSWPGAPGPAFSLQMAGWRILEEERCGRGDADVDAQVRGGQSLGPSRGHHSPLALQSGTSWHNHGRDGVRRSTSRGPSEGRRGGPGTGTQLLGFCILKLVLLPGRACLLGRIPPSTPLKGTKESMGRGVHLCPEGRSLCFQACSPGAEWKEVPTSVLSRCLGLCDLMDCNPPGSSAHGISQARILE